jgi:hypothetical protein
MLTAASGLLLLAGCSTEQPAQTKPSSVPNAAPDAKDITLAAGDEALEAGTYMIDLDAHGSGEEHFPSIEITVPDGWSNIDGWGINSAQDTDRWVAITFWDVDEVFAHPCEWQRRTIQPGRTVAALASALGKQPLRDATAPVDVTVDGFNGVQMQWSVPKGFDFSTCDADEAVGDRPFKSWTATASSGGGERYQQGAGQVDRLWILDVDGERLVIDAMYMPSTTPADRKALFEVVDSIRFGA